MPHQSLKLIPGVDTTKTPALNEAAISQSDYIRFLPDMGGNAYAQILGGWQAYYPGPMLSIVRALKSWEDLDTNIYLGVGAESGLYAIQNSTNMIDISPRTSSDSAVPISTVYPSVYGSLLTSTAITINDTASDTNTYSFVYFYTPISIGGTKLYGEYTIDQVNSTSQYIVNAETATTYNSSQTATITNASPAVVTVTTAPTSGTVVYFTTTGTLPTGLTANTKYFVQKLSGTTFNVSLTPTGSPINTSSAGSGTHTAVFPGQTAYISTTANSAILSVLFPNHGLSVAGDFAVTVATTVGGIVVYGVYQVLSITDANNFTFVANNIASTSASAFENNDLAYLIYYYSAPPNYPATSYGAGSYGSGTWGGVGTGASSLPGANVTATDWSLDSWGDTLIANPAGGPIFAWIPKSILQNAFLIHTAPLVNDGVFVSMPQRQLVAWGSTFTGAQDPLLIRWSDVENYNLWDADTTNQAGSFRIPTGSRIVGCMQAMQQGLIWTDLEVYAMQYIGYPLVYGFNKVGANCGLIARKAMGQLGNSVYWMSQKQFFMLSANGVQPIVCPVWDVIFQDLDTENADKIRCAPNTAFNEITWYYPSLSGGTGEVDAYVKYNVILQQWDFGSLARTAWIDQSQLGPPIGAGLDTLLYQHEIGNSANGQAIPSFFTTGYFAMREGDQLTFVDQIWPDMKWGQYNQNPDASVYVTINTVNYPGDTPISYGPYSMKYNTQYISTRIRGRLFSFTISSNDAYSFWRLGNIRYRIAPDGKF